ncbi:MAG: phosphatase PAP2 family protein [Gemmataceae bacterium]|nr:phosphatase PAP2 family protein [Gemmataceae bacterium]
MTPTLSKYWRRLGGTVAEWLGSRDLDVLLAVLVLVVGAWSFIELADEVREGGTPRFDEALIRALRHPADPADPIGPRWLAEAMRDLTALGSVAVLFLVTLAVSGYLLLRQRYRALVLVLVATLGGQLLSSVLKDYFARPRPAFVPHLAYVSTASFPSGHSMLSAIVYLTLGALLTRLVEPLKLKLYFLTLALLLTFLVGCSRVFLGVHYPTDVLAGWSAGLTWAVLCWLVARSLQRRGAMENPRPD